MYIYRLKAGGSPELRGTLSLDAIPERSFLYTDGGGGGGVITSCEVRWMMLNPGRCCLVGRCCYVASSVVVYRRGVGGCNNVMWSASDDVESWKMLLGWKMLLRCKFRCKMKKVRSSFRPWFSSALSHVLLLNRTTKIKETALQMVSMFHTSMGHVKFSCFSTDKRQVLPRWKWKFDWSNHFREKHKTL